MKTNIFSKSLRVLTIALCLISFSSFAQVTKEYPVSDFNKIKAGRDFNIYLSKGDKATVKLEAEEELQEIFKVSVENNQLVLDYSKNNKKSRKHKVYVTYTNLVEIDASGACNIKGDSVAIKADKFYLECSGASDVKLTFDVNELTTKISGASNAKLSGKATTHNAKISGAADLKSYNLATEITSVDVSGAGNARVNAKNKITGEISGAGNMYYAEEPIEKNVSTSGAGSYKKSKSTNDSTKVRVGNKKIVIVDDETGADLAEVDYDEDFDKNNKLSKVKYRGLWGGCELGFNGYMDNKFSTKLPDEYKFLDYKPGTSLAFNLNLPEVNFNLTKKHFGITTGLGFSWNNYKFQDKNTILRNDTAVIFGYTNPNKDQTKSKLTTVFITVPLLVGYQTGGKHGRDFRVNVGAIASYKIKSYTKRVINDENKIKDTEEYHLNPFRCEATVRLGWKHFNLFANYAITEMFKSNEGPKVYPFTVGLALVSF